MTDNTSQPVNGNYPVGSFQSDFTGEEFFLLDHVIQGKKILPGMAYLEIARAAIARSIRLRPDEVIVLSESFFIRPLIVTARCAVETKVYPGACAEFGVEVTTPQGIHFQTKASVRKAEELKAAAPSRYRWDLEEIAAGCARPGPTKTEFYRHFLKKGIEIGPRLQGIQEIRLGEKSSFVKAHIPGTTQRGMFLDVGVLDSFIQSSDVLMENPDRVGIPYAAMRTEIFGPLGDTMHGHIVKTERGIDFTLADPEGNVKIVITDFIGREFNAQEDQLVFYHGQLERDDAPATSTEGTQSLVVVDDHTDFATLAELCLLKAKELIRSDSVDPLLEVRIPGDKPEWIGISGLLKTVSLEHPTIRTRLLVGDVSYREVFQPLVLPEDSAIRWSEDGTFLITGGMGGLGRALAEDIAIEGRNAKLILVGRSEPDATKAEFLEHLRSLGAEAEYVTCDVADAGEVERLVGRYPRLTGVFHCSGILADNYIAKKDAAELRHVMRPKVTGIESLDRCTSGMDLEYFVAFSSIAAVLGNPGQADYCAANAYMDAFIRRRAELAARGERRGRSVSIDWSLWEGPGMQLDDAYKQTWMRSHQIKPLAIRTGLSALKRILAQDRAQVVVAYGNERSIAGLFERKNAPATHGTRGRQERSGGNEKLMRAVVQAVKAEVATHQKHPIDKLDEMADWEKFGFDSISLASFVNQINSRFEVDLTPAIFFEATHIQAFATYLMANHGERMSKMLEKPQAGHSDGRTGAVSSPGQAIAATGGRGEAERLSAFAAGFRKAFQAASVHRDKDIAVIGMSCRIAGARTPEQLWEMLDAGKDMITEIPSSRWDWRDYPGVPRWGSFIDGVEEFDSLFFGISPAEALYMSPEQRLMMQYVWECLENAGYAGDKTRGTNTGLFMGCGPSSYDYFIDQLPVEAYTATGFVPSVGPNRISYWMDWHGPSNPVETACSSALVAVHRAVEAIHAGHCDMALAGGVSLLLSPDGYVSFSKSGMLCPDGKCKTFSSRADGYVRGEGVGVLMLKPLKAALRDGDFVHAVIKGTAENHGGRTNTLTAPNPKAQAAVIKQALGKAELDFSRIGYIECHGTGTPLGDPVEINGLKMVAADLIQPGSSPSTCKLGSIKSNIGHLEYAAGIAGVIKVILQLQRKRIARSLHCESINPYIRLEGSHFEIAQHGSDWEAPPGVTRAAGVSSFGFGGVNAHVVLEEFVDTSPREAIPERSQLPVRLLPLSAKHQPTLLSYASRLLDHVESLADDPAILERIAFTLQEGRAEWQERAVFLARSMEEFRTLLRSFVQSGGKPGSGQVLVGSLRAGEGLRITDTQAGRDYLRQLIQAQEMEKLAELWVQGAKVAWTFLHSRSQLRELQEVHA